MSSQLRDVNKRSKKNDGFKQRMTPRTPHEGQRQQRAGDLTKRYTARTKQCRHTQRETKSNASSLNHSNFYSNPRVCGFSFFLSFFFFYPRYNEGPYITGACNKFYNEKKKTNREKLRWLMFVGASYDRLWNHSWMPKMVESKAEGGMKSNTKLMCLTDFRCVFFSTKDVTCGVLFIRTAMVHRPPIIFLTHSFNLVFVKPLHKESSPV